MRQVTETWRQLLLHACYLLVNCILWTAMSSFKSGMASPSKLSPIRLDGRFVIKDYDIVYPVFVGGGETTLTGHYNEGHLRRPRRSTDKQTSGQFRPQATSHLNISGLGQTFLVKLEPNSGLLAPGFQVYYRSNGSVLSRTWPQGSASHTDHADGSRPPRHVPSDGDCLYRGDIISHRSSRAAFSMCGGHVLGMLMTEDEDYVIEPVPSRQRIPIPHAQQTIPHVMYRASSLRQRTRHYESRGYSQYQSGRPHRAAALEWPFDRRRRKRAAFKLSQGLTAELLVVADKSMYYAHKSDDVIMYILSIMNIVSQLYKDSSLGTTIKITLVGLVIMQTDEPKLSINYHAGQTLQNFCQWQSGVTGTYGKHDHAVLLTALDICSHKNQPCDTLGYAPIEGMCDSSRSCSINEDTGLATGYTVAHEMGHNLGMFHDGGKDMCPHATGTIMSPKLTTGGKGGIFTWSSCSRDYLIKFLHKQQAKCLWKSSLQVSRLRFPLKLPGEIYDADQQCAWLFGKGSKHCIYNVGKNLCQHLWCQSEGHLCQTKYLPAADGTSCEAGKWCVQGQCVLNGQGVQKDSLEAVDGGWSDWGAWSKCSRTCGGGVRQRDRRCDNPRPLYGGEPCIGISRSYKLCSTQDCDTSKEDFRTIQCRRYDRRPFHGSYYKWRPYTKINQVSDQCKLYCQALGYDFITALSNQVQDGTPCNKYSSDVCVDGSCKSYGCDMIIDSDAKEDSCGVCRGDNSTCRVVKGEFRSQPRLRTYFPITVIPKHSRHIHIKEETYSHNFVAIRDIYGNYYLNGNMNMDAPGVYTLGGVRFEYRRTQNMQESLVAKGPLKQDIVLEVLVMGRNPGILYDYTLPTRRSPLPEDVSTNHYPPHNDYQPPPRVHHPNQYDHPAPRKTTPRPTARPTPPRHFYSWRTIKFNCSETCGGGEQTQRAQCWLDQRYHVNPGLCDPKRRPFEGSVACNTQPCEPRWVTYEWRTCSRTCGGGKQVRKVRCRQKLSSKVDRRVDKRMCSRQPKPTRRRWCNTQDCPAVWVVSKWSECSVSCGSGVQNRELSCQSLTSYGFKSLSESACHHLPRHISEKTCQLAECQKDPYQWVVSSWSKCSASCGMGVKTRALRCTFNEKADTALRSVDSHYCSHISKPSHVPLQQVCTNQACSPGAWYTSAWSKCSATCGNGVQTRLVYCRDIHNHHRSTGCDWLSKPVESQHCNTGHCPVTAPYRCVDQFSWCNLVPKHNVCRHSFYGTRCCHSCRNHQS